MATGKSGGGDTGRKARAVAGFRNRCLLVRKDLSFTRHLSGQVSHHSSMDGTNKPGSAL
jgi:hypothetical protein